MMSDGAGGTGGMLAPETAARPADGTLEALSGLCLPVSVRIGRATLRLEEILSLRAGSVVTLEQQLDEPVELLVGGQVVAEGELVAIDDELAVRITRLREEAGGQ